jgi:hypothetical protein
VAFEDSGLEAVLAARMMDGDPETLAHAVITAVEVHAGDVRLGDDLTVAILSRRGCP